MENITESQKKILKIFYDMQCYDDSGYMFDECPVVRYSNLEKELGLTKDRIKPDIIDLRNIGIIWLGMAVDSDYMPSGSGWILTEKKGADLVKELFFVEEEENSVLGSESPFETPCYKGGIKHKTCGPLGSECCWCKKHDCEIGKENI